MKLNEDTVGKEENGIAEHQEKRAMEPSQETAREALSERDSAKFAQITAEAFSDRKTMDASLTGANYQKRLEAQMLQDLHGLPEQLAARLGTVNPEPFNRRAAELREEIGKAKSPEDVAALQVQLIYQYIAIISRVQNGGDSGFLPSLAREVEGIDCSLSAWCLQEKLQGVPQLTFQSGYARGHAIAILTLANGKIVYVDAQNGFVTQVDLQEEKDTAHPKTAYPIYKISNPQRLSGHLEGEGEVMIAREDGCDYLPPYVGVHPSNILHSVGNMHMLWRLTPEAVGDPAFWNVYRTKAAAEFRQNMRLPPLDTAVYAAIDEAFATWKRESGYHKDYVPFVLKALEEKAGLSEGAARQILQGHFEECDRLMGKFEAWKENGEGGVTLADTRFDGLSEAHHQQWRDEQEAAQVRATLKRE
ncbi:hypothetical protein FJZ28_01525 [Candidatus Peregrinibacteria bacterium]|nr:hypothetical protein [Candidatus Peregrinibacteria bacterium]